MYYFVSICIMFYNNNKNVIIEYNEWNFVLIFKCQFICKCKVIVIV